MKVISTIKAMQSFSESLRQKGKTIALVPTMGFLHEGHVSLMRAGRKLGDVLMISIFVNPIQFGPGEDYDNYPRDFAKDVDLAGAVGVDCVFAPSVGEIYPEGYQTFIRVENVSKNLCGISRPTHFQGVATVVAKLFNCTKPHFAIFGEKDFQQLLVIKRMVKDLNVDIQIVGVPIVREKDGLAMSSRNRYLNAEERKAARSIPRSLFEVKKVFDAGQRDAATLIEVAREVLRQEPLVAIEYIKVCDVTTLRDLSAIAKGAVMAMAVTIGRARLIDNLVLQ